MPFAISTIITSLKIAKYGIVMSLHCSHEQFTQAVDYSHGSVRNQIVHILRTDDAWFSGLRGVEFPEPFNPADFDDRKIIRAHWDNVEQNMRDYLAKLQDDLGVNTEYQDYIFYVYGHP